MLDINVNFSHFDEDNDDSDEIDYLINQVSAKKLKEPSLPQEEPEVNNREVIANVPLENPEDSICCTRRIMIAEDNEFNLDTVI